MSRLVDFYRGVKTDTEGFPWTTSWFGPTTTWRRSTTSFSGFFHCRSRASSIQMPHFYPRRTKKQAEAIRCSASEPDEVFRAYPDIPWSGVVTGESRAGREFQSRGLRDVWAMPNHNWLRITRILRSLTLLGMKTQADALFARLDAMYTSRKFPISADTFRYWTEAVGREMILAVEADFSCQLHCYRIGSQDGIGSIHQEVCHEKTCFARRPIRGHRLARCVRSGGRQKENGTRRSHYVRRAERECFTTRR